LESNRKVSAEEGFEKSKKFDALFVETSAKTGHGIQDLFRNVTTILLNGKLEDNTQAQPSNEEKGKQLGTTTNKPDKKKMCSC